MSNTVELLRNLMSEIDADNGSHEVLSQAINDIEQLRKAMIVAKNCVHDEYVLDIIDAALDGNDD